MYVHKRTVYYGKLIEETLELSLVKCVYISISLRRKNIPEHRGPIVGGNTTGTIDDQESVVL